MILPIRNFTDFDLDIYQAASRSGPDCVSVIRSITAFIDKAFDNGGDDLKYL